VEPRLFGTENSEDILQVASPIPNHGYFVNAGDTRRQDWKPISNP